MPAAVAWSLAVLLAGPTVTQGSGQAPREMVFKVNASPIPGVPLPPEGILEEELTRLETARRRRNEGRAREARRRHVDVQAGEGEIRRKIAG